MAQLKSKQKCFVDEYLKDLNATQAAIRSGYSERTANKVGPRLLVNIGIQSAIQAAMEARAKEAETDALYVLKRLRGIDEMDCLDILNANGSIRPIKEWPKIWRQFIAGFEVAELFEGSEKDREMVGLLKKIKWPDKLKNLELLGKHVNVQAFRDKLELTGPKGGPIQHTQITPEKYEEISRRLADEV